MNERGFTMVELLVAIFLIALGLLAIASTFDTSRNLVSASERKEASVHIAEQEIERIRAMDYGDVGLTSLPSTSSNQYHPNYWVTGSSYRYDHKAGGNTEPMVVAAGGFDPTPTTWSDGKLSGEIYRYVTWVNDAACPDAKCPGTQDYKRVTVAVTVNGQSVLKRPVAVFSKITPSSDPTSNPAAKPSTTCTDGGVPVECTGISGTARTFYLHDTNAVTHSTRQTITGHHNLHPTVATTGTCSGGTTTGCPKPDLMSETPPPSGGSNFRYSEDMGTSYAAGRLIQADVACNGAPSANNQKSHFWVTPPLTSAVTLNGDGGIQLFTHTKDAVADTATLCLAFYDVPNSITNLIGAPATEIGRTSSTVLNWPTELSQVGFNFDFLSGSSTATIATNRRIGVRAWIAAGTTQDIVINYDHSSANSLLALNHN